MKLKDLLFIFILFTQGGFSQTSLQWNKMYVLDSASLNTQFTTAQKLNQNIVVGAFIKNPLNNLDYDPLVLEYDVNGNLVLNWSNQDSSINEVSTNVQVDTSGMIYILTDCYEYSTNNFISTLVKLNPVTQQEIFRINYPSANYPSDFILANNNIYLFQANPINRVIILDLQGNLLQDTNIPFISRIQKLLATKEYIYIIGDTTISPNFVLKFEKLDFLGNSISSYTTTFQNINIGDAVVNDKDNLLYTGTTISDVIAIKLDSAFGALDTAFASGSASQSCGLGPNGESFIAYNTSPNTNISRIFQTPASAPFITIDSSFNHMVVSSKLIVDSNMNFYLLSAYRDFPGSGNVSDSRITYFDSLGNEIWEFKLDNIVSDLPRQLYVNNGAAYGISLLSNNLGLLMVNVYKIGITTGVSEHSKESIYFYPNPLNSNTLHISENLTGEFSLFTLTGQLLETGKLNSSNSIELNYNLSTGCYILKLQTAKMNLTHKLNYYE